jgi:hypothetical protein
MSIPAAIASGMIKPFERIKSLEHEVQTPERSPRLHPEFHKDASSYPERSSVIGRRAGMMTKEITGRGRMVPGTVARTITTVVFLVWAGPSQAQLLGRPARNPQRLI